LKQGLKFENDGGISDDNNEEDILNSFFSRYYGIDTAREIAALGLNPRNQGKEVRIDFLCYQASQKGAKEGLPVNTVELKRFINKHYPSCYLEDPPQDLFTENVMHIGGNAVTCSGNFPQGSFILNHLLKAVNFNSENYPQEFVQVVNDTSHLLLTISDAIAEGIGHGRNIVGEYYEGRTENEIQFQHNLDHVKRQLGFGMPFLKQMAAVINVDLDLLNRFVLRAC
jgi:hypothetical protein